MGEPDPSRILSGKARKRKKSGSWSRLHKFSMINTCFSRTTGWMGRVRSASGGSGERVSTPMRGGRFREKILRRVHADTRPVFKVALIVGAQPPICRPTKIEQDNISGLERAVTALPFLQPGFSKRTHPLLCRGNPRALRGPSAGSGALARSSRGHPAGHP